MMCENGQRKKVLLIIPSLRGGGSERVTVTIANYLNRNLYDVSLVIVNSDNAVYLELVASDVRVINLDCRRVRSALYKMGVLLYREKPDVVYSTLGHLNIALALLKHVVFLPICYIARESSIVSENLKATTWPWMWKKAYALLYSSYDMVICQSISMYEDMISNYNVPPDKVRIINNPISIDAIKQDIRDTVTLKREGVLVEKRRVNLVAAGRMSFEKGFDILIEAMARYLDDDITLVLLGDGPLRKDYEDLVAVNHLENRVKFVGYTSNPFDYFADADAFVLSSRYEGFPNVVLEALACGIPVVSTPAIGGVCEILSGKEYGAIAKGMSSAELAAAILLVPELRRPTYMDIAEYDVGVIIKQYDQALSALL